MTVRVGINGFGRIGRNILRAIIEDGRTDISVVAINDLGPVETNAHLLKYDSVHGKFPNQIDITESTIDVGTGPIRVTAIKNPEELDWNDVDIALECTGIFNKKDIAAKHIKNGSKRVLVSAPCANADKTVVFGVNHQTLTKNDLVVTISSSGNSQNIVNVLDYCSSKKINTLALSGLKNDNNSIRLAKNSIYVPMKTYGMVECMHQVYLHLILDNFMGIEEWNKSESQNMDSSSFKL